MSPLVFPNLTTGMDLQTGLDIISGLPLANSQQAHEQIKDFLDTLLKSPPDAETYLELLEQLRPSLCFVAEDLARHFIDKPLPLGEMEEQRFRQTIITWIKMARCYASCAKLTFPAKGPEHSPRIALILHRCIYYTGMALLEHHRVRRELPAELWGDLHSYYATAEKRTIDSLPVPDPLDPQDRKPDCRSAYLGLLLYELANPYGLSVSDQNLVRTWADQWTAFVSLQPLSAKEPLPSFVLDLKQKAALRPSSAEQTTANLRRLDTLRLTSHLKQIREQLDQKVKPARIDLGASCTSRQCKRVLDHVWHPWSQVLAPRAFPRRATSGDARLGVGFTAAYTCVSGKPQALEGNSPGAHWDLDLFPPGAVPGQAPTENPASAKNLPGQWSVADQSAKGFRLTRARGAVGQQIALGQLLAVCPDDGKRFILAQAMWLMQKRRDGMVVGVAALPGLPKAIKVSAMSIDDDAAEAHGQAFLLPAISSNAKASLVIPQGWYRADRVIEIATKPKQRVRLRRLIRSGPDFEQVSFADTSGVENRVEDGVGNGVKNPIG